MKKIILVAIAAIFSMTSCSTYNGMVTKEEAVKTAWSNVETQYQRRADLIPNLVSTVNPIPDTPKFAPKIYSQPASWISLQIPKKREFTLWQIRTAGNSLSRGIRNMI